MSMQVDDTYLYTLFTCYFFLFRLVNTEVVVQAKLLTSNVTGTNLISGMAANWWTDVCGLAPPANCCPVFFFIILSYS